MHANYLLQSVDGPSRYQTTSQKTSYSSTLKFPHHITCSPEGVANNCRLLYKVCCHSIYSIWGISLTYRVEREDDRKHWWLRCALRWGSQWQQTWAWLNRIDQNTHWKRKAYCSKSDSILDPRNQVYPEHDQFGGVFSDLAFFDLCAIYITAGAIAHRRLVAQGTNQTCMFVRRLLS